MKYLLAILSIVLIFSCSKKEALPTKGEPIKRWEKYIGNYYVYDTLGNFMYDMSISHSQSNHQYPNDSLTIVNFADTFDLNFLFNPNFTGNGGAGSKEYLNIGVHDSIIDYNNKSWFVASELYETNSGVYENSLINDTMVMYFKMDNIKYYMQEAQPYYMCKCKHVAVKQ